VLHLFVYLTLNGVCIAAFAAAIRCLYWATSHGYCLWSLLSKLLVADSVEGLISIVLSTFESGFSSNAKLKEMAKEKCIAAGGVPALRLLYPWHPSFQAKEEASSTDIQVSDFQSADGKDAKGGKATAFIHIPLPCCTAAHT
jgi:hypothetical protein